MQCKLHIVAPCGQILFLVPAAAIRYVCLLCPFVWRGGDCLFGCLRLFVLDNNENVGGLNLSDAARSSGGRGLDYECAGRE